MPTPWPPVSEIRWDDTHRLIPDAYAIGDAPLLRPLATPPGTATGPAPGAGAADPDDLDALVRLSAATNRRLAVQRGAVPSGIHVDELVFATPHWTIVNAAFCYAHPQGSRFNGPDRGAWYAAREVETSLAEVAFHKSVELAETGWWDFEIVYRDFLSDLHGHFADLRPRPGKPRDRRATACLAPDSYVASQDLAARLLDEGALGLVYPSVRRPASEPSETSDAIVVFRPAAVGHVRRNGGWRLTWSGSPTPTIEPAA